MSDHQWANTENDICYGGEGTSNVVRKVNCRTGAQVWRTVLPTGYTACRSGDGEGRISDDDRYLALECDGGKVVVVDLSQQAKVLATKTMSARPNNVTVSATGRYVVINMAGTGTPYVYAWDWAANTTRTLDTYGQHGDVCQEAGGAEWYVQNDPRTKAIRLSDGFVRYLFPSSTVFGESHVSCTNIDRDGWVYLSEYAATNGLGHDQVVAVRLDGSGIVEVFAHAHHASNVYEQQPQAAPNRTGDRVAFASEWGGSSFATYVASQP